MKEMTTTPNIPEMGSELESLLSQPTSKIVTDRLGAQAKQAAEFRSNIGLDVEAEERLREKRPVFVVSNLQDRNAVERSGYRAIVLFNDQQVKQLVTFAHKSKVKAPVFLLLRNDEFGREAAKTLLTRFQAMHQPIIACDGTFVTGGLITDPNWCAKETAISALLSDSIYFSSLTYDVSNYLATDLEDDILCYRSCICFKVGFPSWEKEVPFLPAGIHVLTGEPGCGKTTLASNLALNMVRNNIPVLYFSLEQSEFELITKLLACEAYRMDKESTLSSADIRTDAALMRSYKYAAVKKSLAKSTAGKLFVFDNIRDPESIVQTIRNFCELTGEKPLVVIDYLQKIAEPIDAKGNPITDVRMANSINMELLRTVCVDKLIPMVLLSSMARNKYGTAGGLDACKESGEIEYSAASIMTLHRADGGKAKTTSEGPADPTSSNGPRKMCLEYYKNRYGKCPIKLRLDFYPSHDSFVDPADDDKTPENTSEGE